MEQDLIQSGNINANNLRTLKAQNFVKIIACEIENISNYLFTSAHAQASEMSSISHAQKHGKELSYYSVKIPPPSWRHAAFRHTWLSVPEAYRPNPTLPMVYCIEDRVYFNRRDFGSQEPKPPLSRGIDLLDCRFLEDVHFDSISSKSFLQLISCNFLNNFKLFDSIFKFCEFESVNITSDLSIKDLQSEFLNLKNIKSNSINLTFNEKSPKKITLNNIKANNVEVIGKSLIEEVVIENLECNTLTIIAPIKSLKIHRDSKTKTMINLLYLEILEEEEKPKISINTDGLCIFNLTIKGILNGGRFIIKDSDFKELNIIEFTNNSVLKINNSKIQSALNIIKSSIGKAEMNNVQLDSTQQAQIYQSNISEMSLFNTQLLNRVIAKDEADYYGLREIYCQLKGIAIRQKNKVDELVYQQLEFDAYEKTLKTSKKWTDKIIIFSNKHSNNHGQNWEKALLYLFTFSLILFILIRFSLDYTTFNHTFIFKDIALFLNFTINPLRKFSDFFKETQNPIKDGIALLLDGTSRLVSAYFIFQFLRAFRKYSQ